MASNFKHQEDEERTVSVGTRELRQARSTTKLSLETTGLRPIEQNMGSDPYNTSGSFDRKKNWVRVGKR